MEIGEKIRLIRTTEKLTQGEFADMTGLTQKTVENYEQGIVKNYNAVYLQQITTHERFSKYTLWLMNDVVMPDAGQISPEVEKKRLGRSA